MSVKMPAKLFLLRAVLCLFGLAALAIIVFEGISVITGGPKLTHQVVASVVAPGGHLKAVLTRIRGSDFSRFGYTVDVTSTAVDNDMARVADIHSAEDSGTAVVAMIWKDERTLILRSPRSSFVQKEPGDYTVAGEPITVLLQPQQR